VRVVKTENKNKRCFQEHLERNKQVL